MRRAAAVTGGLLAVARIDAPADASMVPPNCIPVWQPEGLPADLLQAPVGCIDARAGAAAAICIEQAAALAMRGSVAAIVTAPIHKEALSAAASTLRVTPRCSRHWPPPAAGRRRCE
jgi:4-hydroxythreonine-4-phosphate dehydrogenase